MTILLPIYFLKSNICIRTIITSCVISGLYTKKSKVLAYVSTLNMLVNLALAIIVVA